MKITKQLKLGSSKYNLEFEGLDLHNALIESKKVSIYDLDGCGLCKSPNIGLDAYNTKQGHEYTKVLCRACKANLTLGKRKDGSAIFYRRNADGSLAWQAYVAPDANTGSSQASNAVSSDNDLDEVF